MPSPVKKRPALTISGPLRLRECEEGTELTLVVEPVQMPKTRGDCANGPRPCPFARCKYHLAVDVKLSGSVRLNHGDIDFAQLSETCLLDVVDKNPDGCTFAVIGEILNIARQRVKQIEEEALAKLREADLSALKDLPPALPMTPLAVAAEYWAESDAVCYNAKDAKAPPALTSWKKRA